jgi:hypothetical protein
VYNSCFSYISQNTFRSFINTYFQRKLRTHLDFQVRIVFGCVLNTFSTVYPGTKRFALSTQDINLRTGRVLRKWDETSINLMEVLRDDPHVLQLKGRTTYSRTADGSRFCVLLYEEPVPEAMHYLRVLTRSLSLMLSESCVQDVLYNGIQLMKRGNRFRVAPSFIRFGSLSCWLREKRTKSQIISRLYY